MMQKKRIALIFTCIFLIFAAIACGRGSPTTESVESKPATTEPITSHTPVTPPAPTSEPAITKANNGVSQDALTEETTGTNKFSELLRLIPVSLSNSPIILIDYAAYWHNNNVSPTTADNQPLILIDYLNAMMEGEVRGVGSQIISMGSSITGNGRYMVTSTIGDRYVGYNYSNIDAEIQAGLPPTNMVAAIGRFSPQATEDALNRQDEWPTWAQDRYAVENYHGTTLFNWGIGTEMHLDNRLCPPHIDELGRAKPFAISEKYLFSAALLSDVKLMIDVSQDTSDSLTDLSEFNMIAEGMSTLGTYAAIMGYAEMLGYENIIVRMAARSDIELSESQLREMENDLNKQPKLKKFQTIGTGLGEDENGIFMAIVLIHENPQYADANVSLLKKRIENTASLTSDKAWTEFILDMEIHAQGNVLLGKFHISDPIFWARWYYEHDTLLLYEDV